MYGKYRESSHEENNKLRRIKPIQVSQEMWLFTFLQKCRVELRFTLEPDNPLETKAYLGFCSMLDGILVHRWLPPPPFLLPSSSHERKNRGTKTSEGIPERFSWTPSLFWIMCSFKKRLGMNAPLVTRAPTPHFCFRFSRKLEEVSLTSAFVISQNNPKTHWTSVRNLKG